MMKLQALRGSPYMASWRTGTLGENGKYEIRNVTSLDIMGESSYAINLELNKTFEPQPGLSAQYVPPGRGYDVMVSRERDGKIERFIGYYAGLKSGLVYKEGENVTFDMDLEPMALIRGVAPRGTAEVSYRNPRSMWGSWKVVPGEDGSFEIPVPTGDVSLRVGARVTRVSDLQPHETRVVEVS